MRKVWKLIEISNGQLTCLGTFRSIKSTFQYIRNDHNEAKQTLDMLYPETNYPTWESIPIVDQSASWYNTPSFCTFRSVISKRNIIKLAKLEDVCYLYAVKTVVPK